MMLSRGVSAKPTGTARIRLAVVLLSLLTCGLAQAADKIVKVGVALPLTGADAGAAAMIKNAVVMAFDAANQGTAVPGYKFDLFVVDSGTATAGQYDPARAAFYASRLVADKEVIVAIGPMMSGEAKSMTPILSMGGLAAVTPSVTNPDLTSPKFAEQYCPAGKPILFRTVTTDTYQGPGLANYAAQVLKVKSVYVLDDSGAYGVGLADRFQKQAEANGIKIAGRDRLDPKSADYTALLTKIKSMNVAALYYGGVGQAAIKLMKQAKDVVPGVLKLGGDGLFSPDVLSGAGWAAAEGWYVSTAAPHLTEDAKAAQFVAAYAAKFGAQPSDYVVTAYDAALVVIDSVKRVAATGKPVTRQNVRDAIQTAKVPTIQGVVSFDANGDLADRTVSVFRIQHDASKPDNDVLHQFKYLAVAPQ